MRCTRYGNLDFYWTSVSFREGLLYYVEIMLIGCRFDSLEVLKKCQEVGRGLATSYYAVIDPCRNLVDRKLANHVIFAWQFDKVNKQKYVGNYSEGSKSERVRTSDGQACLVHCPDHLKTELWLA